MKLINVDPSELNDPLLQGMIQEFKKHFDVPVPDDEIVLRRRENNVDPNTIIIYWEGVSNVQDIDWNAPPKGVLL